VLEKNMSDEQKSREQLLEELRTLRLRLEQAEEKRRGSGSDQSPDRLRLDTDRLPLAYILMDTDLRVLEWNPAAVRIFGYTRDEAMGRGILDLIVPLAVQLELQEVIRRIRIGDMNAHSVNENQTRDGRVITCEWFNTPLPNPDGKFAGVVSLAQDITARRQAEEKLGEYHERVQALSRRLLTVQEEERRRLARELHDEVGQLLTSLKFALEAGASSAASPMTAETRLGDARALIEETLTRVRELSFDLRPALLDHLGLLPALLALIKRYAVSSGVSVNFRHAGLENRFPPEVDTAAYRIVQEALTNVARHAKVGEAVVRVWCQDDVLQVQVEDQGVGFDHDAALAAGRSSGLPGMYERVMLLGGRLVIESEPGNGTHLMAELPASRILDERSG
jgi:PAS domain S-box-containing protein